MRIQTNFCTESTGVLSVPQMGTLDTDSTVHREDPAIFAFICIQLFKLTNMLDSLFKLIILIYYKAQTVIRLNKNLFKTNRIGIILSNYIS
jgi:hypothetical protein